MGNHSRQARAALGAFALSLTAGGATAQESRGSIGGRIMDSSGAPAPGAAVTAVNETTNIASTTISKQDGAYAISFLNPGRYRVEVRLAGFSTFQRSGVNVAVAQSATVDVVLKVGDVSETLSVTADAPPLEKATGSLGQVIDRETLETTPLNGRMIYALLQLAPGVDWDPDVGGGGAGGSSGLKPFDNIVGSSWSLNGGRASRNEFLIDGAPASTRGQYNFAPPVDAVEEFRVQTNTYDAQYGRTGGGVVNLSLKTGTNKFQGQLWEFMRRTGWDANYTVNKSANPPQPRPEHSENQWGALVRGPLVRNRTFFAFTYEGLHQRSPNPDFVTVPTLAERRGDFSQSYVDQPVPRIIYDPLTTRLDPATGRYVRSPFPNNVIPTDRLNPIALRVLALYPEPTDPTRHTDNYYNPDNATRQDYHAEVLRVDHQVDGATRAYLTLFHNIRDLHRSTNTLQGTYANRGEWPETRQNLGGTVDVVRGLGSTAVLNLRAGYSRFTQSFFQTDVREFDRDTLGFQSLPGEFLPAFVIDGIPTIGVEGEGKVAVDNTISVQANLTRSFGRHTLKVGAEYRNIRSNPNDSGVNQGRFHFNDTFTRADPNNASPSGSSVATLLLGYPVNSANNNTEIGGAEARALQWQYPVLFVQDDLRLGRRLTVNLGLRWDYESPVTERYDRTNRGFAFAQASPLADQVRRAPGASECPACADLEGGILFAGVDGQPRGLFDPDRNNFQPRVGFAYVLTDRTVVRGGFGVYHAPTNQRGDPTSFVSNTSYVANDRDGRVGIPELSYNTFADPYPNGLLPATGSSLGLGTLLGQSFGVDNPGFETPSFQQWNLGVSRQLGSRLVVEATYVGSRSRGVNVTRNINAVPAEALARGTAYLQERVTNPFAGLLPAAPGRNGATIQRQELLRPYPQFATINMNSLPQGRTWYHALQVRVEKRFSQGLYFLSSYALARNEQAINFLNAQDPEPVRELADRDRRHRWVLSGRYALPFGQGRRFGGSAEGLAEQLIGGWQVSLAFTLQSGVALTSPDLIALASAKLEHPTRERWFNTCYLDLNGVARRCLEGETPVWQQRAANTLRTTPRNFPDVHAPQKAYYADAALFKEFRIKQTRLQYRLEAFNLFNSVFPQRPNTDFTSSNFGRITNQSSRQQPRQIQMSLKAYF